MLKPAQLYKDELNKKYIETWYDDRYKYYHPGGAYELQIPDNNIKQHHFICIDEQDNITGFLIYGINREARSVSNFELISFTKNNTMLIFDTINHIIDLLSNRNINRIEFWAYKDNPATRGYENLIKKFGGDKVGELHQTELLSDGQLHDTVIYEILQEDYKKTKEKREKRKV